MSSRCFAVVVSVVLALTSVARAGEDAGHARGTEILLPYKQRLQQALRAGMSKGPVEAIAACRTEAPQIAESVSQNGIRVGRASHRLRNPDNVAPDWVSPVLPDYLADDSDREPRSVPLAEGRTGYIEPIVLQPLCTTCHGDALADDVATRIKELYPDDRAVGFKAGDLRGVFWAEFPTES